MNKICSFSSCLSKFQELLITDHLNLLFLFVEDLEIMTSTDKHYIIAMFGASGNINSSVIENLEKIMVTEGNRSSVISNYTLRIITRNPESLSHRKFSIKTEIVKGSICDEVQLEKLLEGVDRVFICLPQCLGDTYSYSLF